MGSSVLHSILHLFGNIFEGDSHAFLLQFFSGIANGGIYACLALALVMIYQATGFVNFAQGEMAMFSTYVSWYMIDKGLPYWMAFVLAIIVSFAGCCSEGHWYEELGCRRWTCVLRCLRGRRSVLQEGARR